MPIAPKPDTRLALAASRRANCGLAYAGLSRLSKKTKKRVNENAKVLVLSQLSTILFYCIPCVMSSLNLNILCQINIFSLYVVYILEVF